MIARAAGVFIPVFFVGLCKWFKISISIKQLVLIWFSGIIRGAVAFALSQQINPKYAPKAGLLVTSTLVVVLATTLVFGGSMSIFSKYLGITNEKHLDAAYASLEEQSNSLTITSKSPKKSPRLLGYDAEEIVEEPGYFSKLWMKFDDNYMRPNFIKSEVI
jgi:NhaP-type Na+/H+ or K+/H+ antiporter